MTERERVVAYCREVLTDRGGDAAFFSGRVSVASKVLELLGETQHD